MWSLSDVDGDGKLDLNEFTVATFLISQITQGKISTLPASLPPSLRASIWNKPGSQAASAVHSTHGVPAPASSGSSALLALFFFLR